VLGDDVIEGCVNVFHNLTFADFDFIVHLHHVLLEPRMIIVNETGDEHVAHVHNHCDLSTPQTALVLYALVVWIGGKAVRPYSSIQVGVAKGGCLYTSVQGFVELDH
jgi:hypothetical protein